MQQGHIIQQDKIIRQKRLLISGLSETDPLIYNDVTAVTDEEKTDIIFEALEISKTNLVSAKRIGAPDQGPSNRPRYLLMEFTDIDARKI